MRINWGEEEGQGEGKRGERVQRSGDGITGAFKLPSEDAVNQTQLV